MEHFIFGHTARGLPIPAYRFGRTGPELLVMGGVHGDEVEGVIAAHGLLKSLLRVYNLNLRLTLVPALNLDGVLYRRRVNANGVDLNRNLPTKDWSKESAGENFFPGEAPLSEPENQALVAYLNAEKPGLIISLHSYTQPMLNVNGDCRVECEAISRTTGYKLEESIGYPTPGCLGTFAGFECSMPTITYELLAGMEPKEILDLHVPALLDGLRAAEARIPNRARPGLIAENEAPASEA